MSKEYDATTLDALFAYARQAIAHGNLTHWQRTYICVHCRIAKLRGRPLDGDIVLFRAWATPLQRPVSSARAVVPGGARTGLVHVSQPVATAVATALAAAARGKAGISA